VKTEIIYGIHPVFEALRAARRDFFEVYIAKDKISKRLEKVIKITESLKIPVKSVKSYQLKSITGSDMHQGIGIKASPYPLANISDIIDKPKLPNCDNFLLIIDNVLDPQNLGALVRTAVCVGVDGIIIPRKRSASPTPTVSKASAGALEHVFLAKTTNMANTIKDLRKKGLWIVGMDMDAEKSIYASDLTYPLAVVIGGEGKGIRPLIKKYCDFLISIPQAGQIDSLNASVAGAVVMYEVFRQRKYKN